ncbi:pyridoxamine 5'-phosphate oxidase family protein [Salmonirosea aquatica]|uniref:General stress protein n=1 Tax=Salmonirosea aquatica TaxID=2654236 RepID=A0A7C9BQ48_9BACT|nr:general stress protein [Cytophagaceae bacterium SJW1-29]
MQDSRHDEDDHIQNLSGTEAIEKLQDLAEGICMFTTFTDSRPAPSRPMALQGVEDDGALYFFSAASSSKNKELAADPAVQLFFCKEGSSEYLSIYGKCMVSRDRERIEKYWNSFIKVWFQGGKEDPDLTVIRVEPEDIRYWDTKNNRMVSFLKMAASLATGKTMDDGVEGELKV